MSRPEVSVSLADLAAAGVRLRPLEVVTIVRELALQVARGDAPGMPSAHVIRLSPSGVVLVEGPVAAGGRPVARAAQLLDTLLPGFDAPPEFRAPGALRLVLVRALGTVDLPPYPTLGAFADGLARFAATEAAPLVRQLVASWAESVAAEHATDEVEAEGDRVDSQTAGVLESFADAIALPPDNELTISDVRRARRATGLTLTQVSERSRIPVTLLRELEWGYLLNWPAGHYGRTQLVRYARAAGLDEDVVVRTVRPLVDMESRANEMAGSAVTAIEPVLPPTVVSLPVPVAVSRPAAIGSSRRAHILAALAIPALIALAVAPAVWHQRGMSTARPPVQTAVRTEPPSAPSAPPSAPRTTATRVPDGLVPPPAGPLPTKRSGRSTEAEPARGLTTNAVAWSPAFSSVGTAMFYHAEADGRSALMRADTSSDGAVLRITSIVNDTARNFHARPSPDGSLIAFDSDREGERAVYIADSNGQRVRRVTGEGFAAVPSWSPDGRSLAFVKSETDRPEVWNLWTVDLASRETRRLTNHRFGQPWGGSWFPDGKRIAYSHEDRLILMDLADGTERIYPSPRKGRLVRTPSVSPDGRRVIFQVRHDGAWLLELKDGSMRKVLADPSAEEYTWSPDGRRVAYHSRRSGSWGVWVMAPR